MREALQEGTLVSAVSTIEYVIPETVVVVETPSPSPSSPPSSASSSSSSSSSSGGGGGETGGGADDDPSSFPSSFPSSRASTAASATASAATTTTTVIESVSLPPGEVMIYTDPEIHARWRRLQQGRYAGVKSALVVRVTAQGEGGVVLADARTISNKIFGTYGDRVTMASQFARCSYGKFEVVYDRDYGPNESYIIGQLSAPGVLDVEIPITMDNPRSVIRQAVQRAIEEKIGVKGQGPFRHVMLVLPKCRMDCGWAAYAYINSYLSVYQGGYYAFPAVGLHEIGHNMGFGHSGGPDGKTYSDHACMMGNPHYKDDVADMCYNPAKSYQIVVNGGGWYDRGRVETFNPMSASSSWAGTLIGVSELDAPTLYGVADHANSRVVLKIETLTKLDLFVGFNRATGMNADNKMASDMVTVTEANNDGRGYSTSAMKAMLAQGQAYGVANWRGTGLTMTVFVDSIRLDASPGYAKVRVTLDRNRAGGVTTFSPTYRPTPPPTPSPTPLPTPYPTPGPTMPPSLSPTTLPPVTPSPVFVSELSTNIESSKGRCKSIMFTITNIAGADVVIRGLDIVNRRNAATTVTIYTQMGSLEELGDYALNMIGWNMIHQSQKMGQSNKLMELDDFASEIRISVGHAQSFYIHSTGGLMYKTADDGGEPDDEMFSEITGQDQAIAISAGRVLRGHFRHNNGPGIWAGVVKYYLN
ncbi:hypothetical protein ACHAW5_010307 [Stephanodiscus triporus]|uniref:Peptidase M11 gametolysin domain-containing protein n=1 Tax=Stephanodiscus triporus TaxID=2934178 RepID=A0ABD3P3U8_9STRA